MDKNERFAEVFETLLLHKKIKNPAELAKILGVSKSSVSRNLSRGNTITQRFADLLQMKLNVNSDYIIKGQQPIFLDDTISSKQKLPGDNQTSTNQQLDELMTPERFERLLTIMEEQQRAINKLIDNQQIMANKIPDALRPGEVIKVRAAGM